MQARRWSSPTSSRTSSGTPRCRRRSARTGAATSAWSRLRRRASGCRRPRCARPGAAFAGSAPTTSPISGDAVREGPRAPRPTAGRWSACDQIDSEGENELYWRAAVGDLRAGPAGAERQRRRHAAAAAPRPPGRRRRTRRRRSLKVGTLAQGLRARGQAEPGGGRSGARLSYVWKAAAQRTSRWARGWLVEPRASRRRWRSASTRPAAYGDARQPARNVSSKCRQPDANLQHRSRGQKGLNQFTYLGDWAGRRSNPGPLRVRSDRLRQGGQRSSRSASPSRSTGTQRQRLLIRI